MNLANRLVENCNKSPNKICLIQKDEKISYKELYNRVANFKSFLESKSIQKGDKVLLLVPMSIELYVSLIAIWSIGAIPCFMDAGFIKNGMKNNEFEDVNSVVGITKYILYSNINKNLKKLKNKINVNIQKKLNFKQTLNIEELEKDYPAILTYTSGTTGKPKIASRSHEFLNIQGEILANALNYENEDVELSSIPIFTLSNINMGITTVITDGNFVSLGKSNPIKIVNQLLTKNVNRIMAAPGILNVVCDYCIKNNIIINNVNKIFTGGGAIFLDFIEKLKSIFPNSSISTLYGSTEAEPIAELDVDEIKNEDIELMKNGKGILAGKIIGVDDCKTINYEKTEIGEITRQEFDNLITKGVGEIVVSGSNVLGGYVNGIGDKENKFSVEGKKYHRTGDLGYIDDDGRLWLRGRIKEPFLGIEAALHSRLKIGKTAIFKNDEKIILVLEENENISESDIRKEINFEKIDEIKYVKKIPVDKRHNTKVDYKELRKILKI